MGSNAIHLIYYANSLSTTFIKLKNLSTISSEHVADQKISAIRQIWGHFWLAQWYKIDHFLDV